MQIPMLRYFIYLIVWFELASGKTKLEKHANERKKKVWNDSFTMNFDNKIKLKNYNILLIQFEIVVKDLIKISLTPIQNLIDFIN